MFQVKNKKIVVKPTADSGGTRIVTFKRDGYTAKLKSKLPTPTSIAEAINAYNRQPK